MTLALLAIGAILLVAAIRNSQGALFSALGKDAPGFAIWAAAILALGAIGFVPGLKPVSRGLLALVILVVLLKNGAAILQDFQSVWQSPGAVSNAPGASQAGSNGATGGVNSLVSDLLSSATDTSTSFASTSQ
jgi:hypothetical protein